ncbi:MAG: hypothetical protein L7S64_10910 [Longimicrobiales bacterium]|jgi:hypothetical protein|nr:hypothetical protein [Longimicrobiales bacterium]
MPNKPMTVTSRNVTLRDFAIFQIKLALDGLKDLVAFNLSIVAIILDFISGRGKRPRLFYSVVRASERFDRWLNLHSVVLRMDERGSDEGLFGGADEDDDSIVGEIERMIKGQSVSREDVMQRLRAGSDALRGKDVTEKGHTRSGDEPSSAPEGDE